jgi:N-methylhydantoinase A
MSFSFDMGGTTAKICVIADGEPLIAHEISRSIDAIVSRRVRACPLNFPSLNSLRSVQGEAQLPVSDALGLLKVGPRFPPLLCRVPCALDTVFERKTKP